MPHRERKLRLGVALETARQGDGVEKQDNFVLRQTKGNRESLRRLRTDHLAILAQGYVEIPARIRLDRVSFMSLLILLVTDGEGDNYLRCLRSKL